MIIEMENIIANDIDLKNILQPEKKRISAIILENILVNYKKIRENDIKEYEIDFLLQKHNIDGNNYNRYSKNENDKKYLSAFVQDLKILITEKINGNTIYKPKINNENTADGRRDKG